MLQGVPITREARKLKTIQDALRATPTPLVGRGPLHGLPQDATMHVYGPDGFALNVGARLGCKVFAPAQRQEDCEQVIDELELSPWP